MLEERKPLLFLQIAENEAKKKPPKPSDANGSVQTQGDKRD